MNFKTLIMAAAMATIAVFPLRAENKVELGMLTCDVEGGMGFVFGSKKDLACTFQRADKKIPGDLYTGSVKKLGLDIGVTGRSIVKWVVLSANADAATPGSLAGQYVGVAANASAGLGVGVNALVGGSNDGFILQPFSVEASKGVNVAIGFAKFELRAVK